MFSFINWQSCTQVQATNPGISLGLIDLCDVYCCCIVSVVGMKLVPSLPPLNAPSMERLSLFNPSDLLWRYPSINFPSPNPVCNYVQMDFKTHLPSNLGESILTQNF